jgi:NAD(P)-dependent dehydrogenase (short-subunit alcohol dehydrogenase family)
MAPARAHHGHEIANAVTFLAAASYVNGAALTIGGG